MNKSGKNKNKKKTGIIIIIVLAVIMLAVGITGNGKGGSNAVNSESSAPSGETQTSFISKIEESETEEHSSKKTTVSAKKKNSSQLNNIPAFDGEPYVVINNNKPQFSASDKKRKKAYESYSPLDRLGRCGTAFACLCRDTMPNEKRGSIGMIKPSGWHTVKYDGVDGKYLYNRCHLIGYQLSAENANERNLITGTRYLNVEGMLPFENMVADYIKETGNHVLYRVTPVFKGNNLVAGGVHMEAWSVEDGGEGISFNVYCYNNQPGIKINYATGDSRAESGRKGKELKTKNKYTSKASSTASENSAKKTGSNHSSKSKTVYRTPSGKKYHYDPHCGGKNSYAVSLSNAKKAGLTPCKKCVK